MGVVHGGGWFIRSSHVALIYSPKPRIYFIHYAFVGADRKQFPVSQLGTSWDLSCGKFLGFKTQEHRPNYPGGLS